MPVCLEVVKTYRRKVHAHVNLTSKENPTSDQLFQQISFHKKLLIFRFTKIYKIYIDLQDKK